MSRSGGETFAGDGAVPVVMVGALVISCQRSGPADAAGDAYGRAALAPVRGAKWVKVMAKEPRPWVRLRRVVE